MNTTDYGEILVSGLNYYGSIENGNTKIPQFISPPVKGDGLVHKASGQHTIQIHTINFTGNIKIEGTLNRDPKTAVWIPVSLTDSMTGSISNELGFTYNFPVPGVPSTGKTVQLNNFYIATGQYAWLRCNVSNISNGILDLVKISF